MTILYSLLFAVTMTLLNPDTAVTLPILDADFIARGVKDVQYRWRSVCWNRCKSITPTYLVWRDCGEDGCEGEEGYTEPDNGEMDGEWIETRNHLDCGCDPLSRR